MTHFHLTNSPILPPDWIAPLRHPQAGALATFEGWVRNHNQGHPVTALTYEVYPELALKEGERILQEALAQFDLHQAIAVHRYGNLAIGDIAVWIGTTASHRRAAFAGTQYIIDEIKTRLPIWKQEFYGDRPCRWVYCRDH
jgi:molybdopterin synthase catalytic subunit